MYRTVYKVRFIMNSMVAAKISLHSEDFERRTKNIVNWNVPPEIKRDVLRFLEELSLGMVNKGKKISNKTLIKYFHVLKPSLEFLNKPCESINQKDLEKFEKALTSGEIKSAWKEKPYSYAMKVDIRIALRIFLKWKLKAKGEELTSWFDCRDKPNTPDYLKESEVEKLYKNARSAEERFLIAVLFDTGARAEEFHNIRYSDIHLPEKNENFVKITLKKEYSKTAGRTISLYWKYSLDAVNEYLAQRIKEGIKSDDPVFNNSYDNSRFVLSRLGKKVLDGKHIHYHLFRHSSATYFARRLNRQELCIRFGWKFSSNMPDVYIAREGVDSKDLDEKFTSTELNELQAKLSKEEYERKKTQEDLIKLQLEQQAREAEYAKKMVEVSAKMDEFKKALEAQGKAVK